MSRRRPARSLGSSAAGRTLLVLFFCAGIAFLGLLAGGEHRPASARLGRHPMDGYYGSQMPRYPGVQEAPAGPATRVGGSQLRMSFFSTDDEPAKVARFYARQWRQQRFFVREDITHQGGVVSAVDVEHGTIYQALITLRGEQTLVFPSVTRSPLRAVETNENNSLAVPLPPGSKAVINLGSQEIDVQARVSLSLNNNGLEENEKYFRRELRSRGFAEEARPKDGALGPGQRVLLFRKGASEITINLTAMDSEGKRVRVHMMEAGS